MCRQERGGARYPKEVEYSGPDGETIRGQDALEKSYVDFFKELGPVLKEGVHQDWSNRQKIAELLAQAPGVRPEDVVISLVEVAKENWSFGNGLATYAT